MTETEKLNIYTKLQKVQSEIKELVRTEENKFQKYFFFNELQVLRHLKPLLEKHQLTVLLSDDITQPFIHEKDGKEHYVKYLKKLEIIDSENLDNKLLFNFWACGSNVDLAKAKGSSETYAIKYLLSKFFLMPVKDEGDPDYRNGERCQTNETFSGSNKTQLEGTINAKEVERVYGAALKKRAGSRENQQAIFAKFDKIVENYPNIKSNGETNADNFRIRLAMLKGKDCREFCHWLEETEL